MSTVVVLDGDLHQALYRLAEDAGYVFSGATKERDPVRVLCHQVLGAYVKAKQPTLEKIAARKLAAENEAGRQASERLLEGQRIGRMLQGLPPLDEEDKE